MCANFISGHIDHKTFKTMAGKTHLITLSKQYLPNVNKFSIFLHAFFVLLVNMFLSFCSENPSRRKTTNLLQISTYQGHEAALANDWNLNFKEPNCSRTNTNQTQTRLKVDLGKPYSLSNVRIYRQDGRSNF